MYDLTCAACGSGAFTRKVDDADLLILSCANCGTDHQAGIALE